MKSSLPLFNDIYKGKSLVGGFWVSHPKVSDELFRLEMYEKFFNKSRKIKAKTEQEALLHASKKGSWTEKEEKDIVYLERYLSQLNESYNKIADYMKKEIQTQIDECENKLKDLKYKKYLAIGVTAESIASSASGERFALSLIFLDEGLKEKRFKDSDIDYMSNEELGTGIDIYLSFQKKISEENVKSMCCDSFIQNLYSLSKKGKFFDRKVFDMTFLQQRCSVLLENYKYAQSSLFGKVRDEKLNDYVFLDKWLNSPDKLREQMENFSGEKNGTGEFEKIKRLAGSQKDNYLENAEGVARLLG